MLKSGIIRIAAATTVTLLLAGCAARLDPAQPEAEISFSAGSLLLRDDADTKSGTPKTGTTFEANDAIAVYGWHNAASELITFGTTTPVTLGSNGQWTYSPIESWQWSGTSDYYDFVAIYPYSCSPTATSSPLTVSVDYDPVTTQYDLMTASKRRLSTETDPCATVPLEFSHRLAAVMVKVTNDDGGQTFRLDACHYRSIIVDATATSVFSNGSFKFSWGNNTRSSMDLLGSAPAVDLTAGNSTELDYDLMIPQDLNVLGSTPSLVLTYTPKSGDTYGDAITSVVPLSSITDKIDNTGDVIETWEEGVIYTYDITIRIGGGVIVNVITTPWEEVEAETPGIMI